MLECVWRMKRRHRFNYGKLRAVANYTILVSGLAAFLTWRLGDTPSKLFPSERHTVLTSSSAIHLPFNILNEPYRLLQLAIFGTGNFHPVLMDRVPSVLVGICSCILFIYIARRWYGRRSMVLGSLLFITSASFLHVSRFAGVDIEYVFGMLALLAIHIGIYDYSQRKWIVYLWLITNTLILYIPGFVWFVLISITWQRDKIPTIWRTVSSTRDRIASGSIVIVGLANLAYSLIDGSTTAGTWLGLPSRVPHWHAYLRGLAEVFSAISIHGMGTADLWLARTPILDCFATGMLIIGVLFYARHWRATRTHLLASYLLLSAILISLHGGVRVSLIIPLLYLVATGGIAYALNFWLHHFPRNQPARLFGMMCIILLVSASCIYNLRQYFVAWTHNKATIALENKI